MNADLNAETRTRVTGPCEWEYLGMHCEGGHQSGRADAVHMVEGRKVCGFHSPHDTTLENLATYGYTN
jgi:hypothetical protein